MQYMVVQTTVGNQQDADKLAELIVDSKLGACVHMYSITSVYWWQGKKEHDKEVVLQIKTLKNKYKVLENLIKSNHPYDVPEIIVYSIEQGSKEYLDWVQESVK